MTKHKKWKQLTWCTSSSTEVKGLFNCFIMVCISYMCYMLEDIDNYFLIVCILIIKMSPSFIAYYRPQTIYQCYIPTTWMLVTCPIYWHKNEYFSYITPISLPDQFIDTCTMVTSCQNYSNCNQNHVYYPY